MPRLHPMPEPESGKAQNSIGGQQCRINSVTAVMHEQELHCAREQSEAGEDKQSADILHPAPGRAAEQRCQGDQQGTGKNQKVN